MEESSVWMQEALAQAKEALARGEVPVGAVLVRHGEKLCAFGNRREATHDPTAHAEILCLREGARLLGDWRMQDCTLYVTLEPCPMCAGAMVMSRLGKCVYGAPDPQKGCCGSVYDLPDDPALGSQTRWEGGVMADACQEVLDAFFARRRKGD
ncbi:MAG: tRNA adenosine(34) deaminase TadA [Clostridia bacterium]|nr:tRNA adenosine(34) deaminase TadA [Clostridia bacterium]